MNTFWTLWLSLLPESVVYLPHPKYKVDYHTHTCTKRKMSFGFSVKFQVAVEGNIMQLLEKAGLKRPD